MAFHSSGQEKFTHLSRMVRWNTDVWKLCIFMADVCAVLIGQGNEVMFKSYKNVSYFVVMFYTDCNLFTDRYIWVILQYSHCYSYRVLLNHFSPISP